MTTKEYEDRKNHRDEVKSFLSRARKCHFTQTDYKRQLKEINATIEGATINYNGDGSQHNQSGNVTENNYVKALMLKEKIEKLQEDIISMRVEIQSAIMTLENPKHREVLTRFYLSYESWKTIANEMGSLDESSLRRLRNRACDKIIINAPRCP